MREIKAKKKRPLSWSATVKFHPIGETGLKLSFIFQIKFWLVAIFKIIRQERITG